MQTTDCSWNIEEVGKDHCTASAVVITCPLPCLLFMAYSSQLPVVLGSVWWETGDKLRSFMARQLNPRGAFPLKGFSTDKLIIALRPPWVHFPHHFPQVHSSTLHNGQAIVIELGPEGRKIESVGSNYNQYVFADLFPFPKHSISYCTHADNLNTNRWWHVSFKLDWPIDRRPIN